MADKVSRVGFVLDGKYEILSEIGHGGMSTVYLARDKRLNKLWAIKEYKQSGDTRKDEIFRESLVSEANLIKTLDHPALVRIVDIIEAEGTIFIVEDYIEGEDLQKVMKHNGGPMPVEDVIDWAQQLCSVFDYLHTPIPERDKKTIVYRDMKPENVMRKEDGTLCILDFGAARFFDENKSTDTTALGTRGFAAPEQFDPTTQTDPRADIYALGITMRYLVTGQNPRSYETDNHKPIRSVNPSLPEGLERIILKCVREDRNERYQDCRELAYDLEHYKEMTDTYKRELKKKLNLFKTLGIAAIVCLVVGILGFILSSVARNSTWQEHYNQAQIITPLDASGSVNADSLTRKLAEYQTAIDIDPSRTEAYEGIIEAVLLDGELGQSEADEYGNLLNTYAAGACSKQEYAQLCYQLGFDYFCYADYGNNAYYSAAKTWFERAKDTGALSAEDANNAEAFESICGFFTAANRVNSSISDEDFRGYWTNLCVVFEDVKNSTSSSAVRPKLSISDMIMRACASSQTVQSLRAIGVSKEDLLSYAEQAYQVAEELQPQVILTSEANLCNEIIRYYVGGTDSNGTKVTSVRETINNVYNSAGNVDMSARAAASNSTQGGA